MEGSGRFRPRRSRAGPARAVAPGPGRAARHAMAGNVAAHPGGKEASSGLVRRQFTLFTSTAGAPARVAKQRRSRCFDRAESSRSMLGSGSDSTRTTTSLQSRVALNNRGGKVPPPPATRFQNVPNSSQFVITHSLGLGLRTRPEQGFTCGGAG